MTIAQDSQVLVVGEAVVDVVVDGATSIEVAGGSAANVAMGVARRGLKVDLITHLGPDAAGELMRAALSESGVRVNPTSFDAQRTSTAIARRDSNGDAVYTFDVNWAPRRFESLARPDCIHLGSLAAFAADPALDAFLDDCPSVRMSFDPNVRAGLTPEPRVAHDQFVKRAGRAFLIKLSEEDARALFPDRSPESVIDTILSLGVALVVMTQGHEGMRLATKTNRLHVPAVPATVVDTIGAGDTVMASLLFDLVGGRLDRLDATDLASAGVTAAAAASITVSRQGADLPWASELS